MRVFNRYIVCRAADVGTGDRHVVECQPRHWMRGVVGGKAHPWSGSGSSSNGYPGGGFVQPRLVDNLAIVAARHADGLSRLGAAYSRYKGGIANGRYVDVTSRTGR